MTSPATTPPATHTVSLGDSVQYAPGVGPRRAQLFGRLGIQTLADLVKHLPHRYEYHYGSSPIRTMPMETIATARGVVVECRWVPMRSSAIGRPGGGSRGRFTASIEDETGRLDLVFFNARYLLDKLHPGSTVRVTGKAVLYNGFRQMANPKLHIFDDAARTSLPTDQTGPALSTHKDDREQYLPIYAATEDLSSEQIRGVIAKLLPIALPQIEDHLHAAFRESHTLPELREAYRMVHQPVNEEEVVSARRRLAYDELLFLQLGFAIKRKQTQTELTSPALRYSDAIDAHIRHRFPFELTADQLHAAKQIAADLQHATPMNRLLQGDVGSGKTVVALYAMLMAVAAGKQAAMMAPTELLCEQHYLSITHMMRGSTVKIGLLTGSIAPPVRTALLHRIRRGEVDIVIGTQAIIGQSLKFHDLAVVVVDEQHRFGVEQRALIRSKAGEPNVVPHTLVMTATPIPRTISLSIFGDLDVSTIAHLPPGRKPIETRVVPSAKSDQVYGYVAKRIAKGEQAYVVLPAIDESQSGLKAVRSEAARLEETHFKGLRIATVHGQLKAETRGRIMQRFGAGQIDVLIATTVIEVGVDVPNASLMVVEHAERFGLAQLHQLRGRVGRGERKSLCVFIADPTTEDAKQRLAAIAATNDGFKIAEADLKIRGMGELLGTRQAGLPAMQVADLEKHLDLLRLARRDAISIVDEDAKLTSEPHTLLRKRLVKQYGPVLGLADVG